MRCLAPLPPLALLGLLSVLFCRKRLPPTRKANPRANFRPLSARNFRPITNPKHSPLPHHQSETLTTTALQPYTLIKHAHYNHANPKAKPRATLHHIAPISMCYYTQKHTTHKHALPEAYSLIYILKSSTTTGTQASAWPEHAYLQAFPADLMINCRYWLFTTHVIQWILLQNLIKLFYIL